MAFYDQIPSAGKILVLDLGFLGDTIHLLPAVRHIRECFPAAELSLMSAQHILPLLEATPWIDQVLGYPRYPKGPKPWQDGGRIAALRRANYQTVINLNGSDRSSILTRLTGAPLRLGRRPTNGGPWFWPSLFTHEVRLPRGGQPVYRQNLELLQQAGFPGEAPRFDVTFPAEARARADQALEGIDAFIHVSPFANDDYKELPADQLADLLGELRAARPDLAIMVSCAPTPRERDKMHQWLSHLPFTPDRVFAGELDLLSLGSLLSRTRLHLGADSGAIHLAMLAGAPLLGWFRQYEAIDEWIPDLGNSRVLIGEASPNGLQNLKTSALVNAALELLDAGRERNESP